MRQPVARADALRNRQAVLNAAAGAFADAGPGVPMEHIAARAGVGMGTVYRHFASKEKLLEAVMAERMAHLAQELTDGPLAEAGIDVLILRLAQDLALKEALVAGLSAERGSFDETTLPAMAALRSALARRLTLAQRHREVRIEVNLDDLLTFAAAANGTAEPARLVLLMMAGLAPSS